MQKLSDDLTDKFIHYQWRLENPMPTTDEYQKATLHYQTNRMFHNKVQNLVSGVMVVITKQD